MNNKLIWAGIILSLVIGGIALVGNNNQSGTQSNVNSPVVQGANAYRITLFDALATSLGFIQKNGCSDNTDAGLQSCVAAGSLATGSTTVLSLANPLTTTSSVTVNFSQLDITGAATTSYKIACGTSSTPYAPAVIGVTGSSSAVILSGVIATGTATTLVGGIDTGTASTTATGYARFQLRSAEYLVCAATSTQGTAFNTAFTDPTSAFAGTYRVEIKR